MCSDTLEIHGFNSCGKGADEDAVGFAKNVSRYTMCVPNTWRPVVAARHSQRTAQHSARVLVTCKEGTCKARDLQNVEIARAAPKPQHYGSKWRSSFCGTVEKEWKTRRMGIHVGQRQSGSRQICSILWADNS